MMIFSRFVITILAKNS